MIKVALMVVAALTLNIFELCRDPREGGREGGRVFGLLSTLSAGLIPLSMGLMGVAADLLHQNVPLIWISTGSLGTLFSALLLMSSKFRELLAYEPIRDSSHEAAPVEERTLSKLR